MPGPYGNYSTAPPENMSYYNNYYYSPETQYQYYPSYSTHGTSREQDYPQYTWDQSTANLGPAPAQEQAGAFRDQAPGYGYGYEGGGFWGTQEYGSNREYYRSGSVSS